MEPETCAICGRPKGDYHRRPVAGECTAPDPTDYTVSIQCLSIALRNTQAALAAARRECEGLRTALDKMRTMARDDDFRYFEDIARVADAALAAPAAGEEGKR